MWRRDVDADRRAVARRHGDIHDHATGAVAEPIGRSDAPGRRHGQDRVVIGQPVVGARHGGHVGRVLGVPSEGEGGPSVDDQAEHGHDADEGDGEDDQRLATLATMPVRSVAAGIALEVAGDRCGVDGGHGVGGHGICMLLADSMVIVPSTRRSGVTGWNGAETETRTRLPGRHGSSLAATPVMSTQVKTGASRPGTNAYWVARTASVSGLVPSGSPAWTLVTRASSRAASATPL